ncbi:MAG TPA: hypothetical protein VG456_23330 [Candidatus Sulfopaludibacter sp.]|jgi:hypothetical protein|nr:hypothetical protein [Candidatus Sulfopaludibacter sp.]
MKYLLGLLLTAALCAAQTSTQAATKAAGHWSGKILIPDHEVAVTVDLDRDAQGVWIGSITVAGSSSVDVPLSAVAVESGAVRFTAPLPGPASFTGKLSDDGAAISGTASNAQGDAPFQLARSGSASVKVPPASSKLSSEFEGSWSGSIEGAGKTRRIGLKLSAGSDGNATAKLVAIDQGNLEIPVSTVTINKNDLQLEVRALSGLYHGTLSADGVIAGEWAQGNEKYSLTFKKGAY